ncbi:tRNA (guanine(10)-N(2))-methyltransferase TRMT11-like [Convolutriloba macropyga]|uniref:tRNA (guanine(10)-N(2))-methyltransferase TRMT11-like n=1 Tax=Convolutriloba macropyga TaxID=536237 RepID=UPI003F521DF2
MRYVLRFAQSSGDFLQGFNEAEFHSLITLFSKRNDAKARDEQFYDVNVEHVYGDIWIVNSSQSEAIIEKIASRSVLLKSIMRLLCYADSRDSLFEQLRRDKGLSSSIVQCLTSDKSGFKVLISTVNKTLTAEQKLVIIEQLLGCLPEFELNVNLNSPGVILHLLEDWDYETGVIKNCFLGVSLPCDERSKVTTQFSIKKRRFIGNTTMDPVLSACMSNMAGVKNGDLVLDPFVGTGGIVLLCGYHGGNCIGSDLDYKTVHGTSKPSRAGMQGQQRAKDESIRTNFASHGFEHRFIDVFINDATDVPWCYNEMFDAIVTDPPYGIREGIKTINSDVKLNSVESHASMQQHSPIEMFKKLVEFAARLLKVGGRLVFWMPTLTAMLDFEPEKHVPKHPAMKLMHCCFQTITHTSSRSLLCMEKVSAFPNSDVEATVEVDYYDLGPDIRFREAYLNSHC